ncbi:hypothetical protein HMPREF1092_02068 [Clostridium thermobutyricum]|uniref:Uncharacterized protein n=1 Tax=Clostridium thermobutyricum TaxID=29372 RepID=N9XZM0_9CLOT|nr:DUF6019 family protein [Clostridium thermobutyricum]ENZ01359.1 hypothetical protein HMPREF1092_02068 [Clostridium thermobutyricum]
MVTDFGNSLIILVILYFVIRWAIKDGIKEAYKDITGKKPKDEQDFEDIRKMYEFSKKHMNNNDKEEL